jgi:hypothetical protein
VKTQKPHAQKTAAAFCAPGIAAATAAEENVILDIISLVHFSHSLGGQKNINDSNFPNIIG